MIVMFSARRLKPGSWEQFRRAWDVTDEGAGGENPPGLRQVVHARNVRDENEVISFGIFDASLDEIRSWRADNEDAELKRQDAMASFVANMGTEGIYEVVETIDS